MSAPPPAASRERLAREDTADAVGQVARRGRAYAVSPAVDTPPDFEALFDLLQPPAWHADAACTGEDPALFFPVHGKPSADGRQLCAGCPVRAECAEAGKDEEYGIWGGGAAHSRRATRTRKRRLPTEADLAEFRRLHAEGLSGHQISARTGFSTTPIRRAIRNQPTTTGDNQ